MEIVSQNSDAEIAKNRAREDLRWPLRKLTANLLRIVRGAGKPHEIAGQLSALIDAVVAYEAAFGHGLDSYDIQQALALDEKAIRSDVDASREAILRGTLRLAAARLLGQDLQARHGENELDVGIRRFEEARAEEVRRIHAKFPVQRLREKRPSKRPKVTI